MKTFFTLLFISICLIPSLAQTPQAFYNVSSGNGNGLRFWNSDNYKIHMGNASEYHFGPVTDYSIKMNMNATTGRGWTWGQSGLTPVAALSNIGNMQIAGSFTSKSTGIFDGNLLVGISSLAGNYGTDERVLQINGTSSWLSLRSTLNDGTLNIGYLPAFNNTGFFSGGMPISFWTSLSTTSGMAERMRITKEGNIGIGETNPLEKLHISNGNIFVEENSLIFLQQDNGTNDGMGIGYNSAGNMKVFSDANVLFQESDADITKIMFDLNNGRVAIGENISPTERLVVDGKILAEEVKVQNVPSSDYVFEPEYNLLPISEVETFIKENKHLPDIPSAEEFKENGVGLGEMDDMLLRKIEELTLYVIEQEKKNEDLNAQLEELRLINNLLIKRIEIIEDK